MRTRASSLAGACILLSLALPAHGQTSSGRSPGRPPNASGEKDPAAILEIGASTSWNLTGGAATFAPNFAVETTPIENWLELEAGVSPFYTRNATEWDTDPSRMLPPMLPERVLCPSTKPSCPSNHAHPSPVHTTRTDTRDRPVNLSLVLPKTNSD